MKTTKNKKVTAKKVERKFDLASLIIGIIFIIIALIAFRNPMGDLATIVIVFAVSALIKAIFEIYVAVKIKNQIGRLSIWGYIAAAFNIIIGLYILFNINTGALALAMLFSIWFIIDSAIGLIGIVELRQAGSRVFWGTLISAVIGIVIGIFLLINPIVIALTIAFIVGIYFLLLGINYLLAAFSVAHTSSVLDTLEQLDDVFDDIGDVIEDAIDDN